jgi:hypothetical protein
MSIFSLILLETFLKLKKSDSVFKVYICNENFDFLIFALFENFIFSYHFNTNLVENFELEVCKFLV